jgi:hypothetical protein
MAPSALRFFVRRSALAATLLGSAMVSIASAQVTTLYWAPGNDRLASGTWSTTDANWSTNSSGTGALQAWPSSGLVTANFLSGVNTPSRTVTVSGVVDVNSLSIPATSTPVTITGGTMNLVGDRSFALVDQGLTVETEFTGTNGLRKLSGQAMRINRVSPDLEGSIIINGGGLTIDIDNPFPKAGVMTFETAPNAAVTINNGRTLTVAGLSSTVTNGTNQRFIAPNGATALLVLDSDVETPLTFYGKVGNANSTTAVSVTKRGSFTQVWAGGTTVNTSSALSTNAATLKVEAGTFVFAKTEGAYAWNAAGTVDVTGGRLRFDNPDQLPAGVKLRLAGGTFDLNNQANTDGLGSGAGSLVQLGTLDLQGSATIDFGTSGAGKMWVADSSGLAWTGNVTLSLANFGAGSELRFGSSRTALTATQLQQISLGPRASAMLDGDGFLTNGTLVVDVGGPDGYSNEALTTLLTDLGVVGGGAGAEANARLGFDTADAPGGSFTIADTLVNTTGSAGGAIGVTKLGSGTLTLSGNNT